MKQISIPISVEGAQLVAEAACRAGKSQNAWCAEVLLAAAELGRLASLLRTLASLEDFPARHLKFLDLVEAFEALKKVADPPRRQHRKLERVASDLAPILRELLAVSEPGCPRVVKERLLPVRLSDDAKARVRFSACQAKSSVGSWCSHVLIAAAELASVASLWRQLVAQGFDRNASRNEIDAWIHRIVDSWIDVLRASGAIALPRDDRGAKLGERFRRQLFEVALERERQRGKNSTIVW